MRDAYWVSDLKLRVGYGITGTAPSSPYQYVPLYNFSTAYMGYDGGKWVNGIVPTNNANDDLKWERKRNLTSDWISLFSTVGSGQYRFYNRRTDDLLYTYTVPTPPNITNSILANVGSMRNQGVEVMLSGDLISRKDMALTLSGNFSYNKNKLISLSNDRYTMEYLTLGSTGEPMQTYTHRLEDGWAVGNFYGWRVDGLKTARLGMLSEPKIRTPVKIIRLLSVTGCPKCSPLCRPVIAGRGLTCRYPFAELSASIF